MQKIVPFLWFDDNAEEAVNYYVSVFSGSPSDKKNSKILETSRYDEASAKASGRTKGSVMVMSFELDGQEFNALNGGPIFKFTEAVSFVVRCENQEEIDYFWEKLSAVPEAEQCGWLKDKFGLSWQIIPKNLGEFLNNSQTSDALMKMKKIDIYELKNAGNKQ